MIPGMLIQVKPYKFFNAFYLLLTPEEHQKRKTGFENILKMDPGMICLVLGKIKTPIEMGVFMAKKLLNLKAALSSAAACEQAYNIKQNHRAEGGHGQAC